MIGSGEDFEFSKDAKTLGVQWVDGDVPFWIRMGNSSMVSRDTAFSKTYNLPQSNFIMLYMIGENPGCRPVDIARLMGIRPPNLVTIIDDLLRAGLVTKIDDRVDRRSKILSLTELGMELVLAVKSDHKIISDFLVATHGPGSDLLLMEMLKSLVRPSSDLHRMKNRDQEVAEFESVNYQDVAE